MPDPRVLIVEDDRELGELLKRGLAEEGFEAALTTTGADALASVTREPPDAFVIDIGLPDADGRDVCQALRARGIAAPVLFLTARDALTDRLAGFGAGGDDYLTKPFAVEELVARLRALVRRGGHDGAIEVNSFRLDPVTHSIESGGVSESLTPTEFRLLAALASRPDEVLRRRELVEAAWPAGAIVHDNTLDVYLARLRRKLRYIPDAPRIATIQRVGYSLRWVESG
jgi:two-component system response regulator MprA